MQPDKWFRTAPNMEGIMEFVRLEPGVYRPVTMPLLPEETAGSSPRGAAPTRADGSGSATTPPVVGGLGA
jgi:hypothetical protein